MGCFMRASQKQKCYLCRTIIPRYVYPLSFYLNLKILTADFINRQYFDLFTTNLLHNLNFIYNLFFSPHFLELMTMRQSQILNKGDL